MKHILFFVLAFALTASFAVAQSIDPLIQSAIQQALPPAWVAYSPLIIIAGMALGRGIKALQNGRGIVGWWKALFYGDNTPSKTNAFDTSKLGLIAALLTCALLIPSCELLKSPQGRQLVVSLAEIGLKAAVEHDKLSPGDALQIHNGVAIVTDGDTTMSKIVKLSDIGLNAAVSKGIVKSGDAVLIKETTAVITQAVESQTPSPAD